MIPKKIHYCWFGRSEKPQMVKRCIESWKKYCPDYEIIEWNEDNFDISQNDYLAYCYQQKKWAFLSDLARLIIIEREGGVYFDTDVELIKNIDSLLKYNAFYGFENKSNVATGLGFGATAHHSSVKNMIQQYYGLEVDESGNYPMITCPKLNTLALLEMGLKLNGEKQLLEDILILPVEFMNPYDDPTGKLIKTTNTISIHWYSKSWLDKKTIFRSKLTKPFHRVFGKNCFRWIKK